MDFLSSKAKNDYDEYLQSETHFFPLPPDKKLNSKEERRRADPAYEIMESRGAERNPEVGHLKKKQLIRFMLSGVHTF